MLGLYNKYKILKRATGQEAEGEFFVLKPGEDAAARAALRAYADATDNKELARDIRTWMNAIEEVQG